MNGLPETFIKRAFEDHDICFRQPIAGHRMVGEGVPVLLDVKSGRPLQTEGEGNQGDIWTMTLSPNGETLATGGGDGVVIFWDRRTLKKIRHLSGHSVPIWSLAFFARRPDARLGRR